MFRTMSYIIINSSGMVINTFWIRRQYLMWIIVRNSVETDYNAVLGILYKNMFEMKLMMANAENFYKHLNKCQT